MGESKDLLLERFQEKCAAVFRAAPEAPMK
jgi:hypothetical protein